jgi:hypothetical protein
MLFFFVKMVWNARWGKNAASNVKSRFHI